MLQSQNLNHWSITSRMLLLRAPTWVQILNFSGFLCPLNCGGGDRSCVFCKMEWSTQCYDWKVTSCSCTHWVLKRRCGYLHNPLVFIIPVSNTSSVWSTEAVTWLAAALLCNKCTNEYYIIHQRWMCLHATFNHSSSSGGVWCTSCWCFHTICFAGFSNCLLSRLWFRWWWE